MDLDLDEEATSVSTTGSILRHGGQEPRLVVVEEQNQSFVIVSTRFDTISN